MLILISCKQAHVRWVGAASVYANASTTQADGSPASSPFCKQSVRVRLASPTSVPTAPWARAQAPPSLRPLHCHCHTRLWVSSKSRSCSCRSFSCSDPVTAVPMRAAMDATVTSSCCSPIASSPEPLFPDNGAPSGCAPPRLCSSSWLCCSLHRFIKLISDSDILVSVRHASPCRICTRASPLSSLFISIRIRCACLASQARNFGSQITTHFPAGCHPKQRHGRRRSPPFVNAIHTDDMVQVLRIPISHRIES
jgi:hypothetical protein